MSLLNNLDWIERYRDPKDIKEALEILKSNLDNHLISKEIYDLTKEYLESLLTPRRAKLYKLPWPPSVNHYWLLVNRGSRPAKIIGKKGREFREAVQEIVGDKTPLTKRLKVTIWAYPPDRRKRDLDNVFKATLDSLEHAGVYEDDNQIDELAIYREEIIKGGELRVRIQEI